MERSFLEEIERLRLGDGDLFQGEGILAVAKALLQSGVSYVGGYQGAPISSLLDVLVQARGLMGEMGIHVEANANEASAAAMLGASIAYPMRGAVAWKSIVGTNVAADALSNLASAGVMGGAIVISGADFGEGSSVIQERTQAFAMKSTMWMMDPRPDLPNMVNSVENAFALSEASNTPVILELRVRACHLQGEFIAKDNVAPQISTREKSDPADFLYDRLAHPPSTFMQEIKKLDDRLPAARKFILEKGLNEVIGGNLDNIGIILQGGLHNALSRRLASFGLGDDFGASRIPLLVLNVTHPLVPEQISGFCAGKDAVLVLEEGNPEYIELQIGKILRQADLQTKVMGKDVMPLSGGYSGEVIARGLVDFLGETNPAGLELEALRDQAAAAAGRVEKARHALDIHVPPRPPGFCTGCPERPVFTAIKLLKEEIGDVHISTDIGCHSFATFEPFSLGNTILGYGMSLASSAAVIPVQKKRPIAIMGDGGFWHNGLQTGVISNLFNQSDGILIIMQNGYSSATGQQYIPSSGQVTEVAPMTGEIENTLRGLGVEWLKSVRTYSVEAMLGTLREAMETDVGGLKVIIADAECMLARQRCLRLADAERLKYGQRVETPRFGIDDEVCTGDHSCIRLSGCPSLTLAPNPDPLRIEPIAQVNNGCLGCGLCGEVAHAAVTCPSFYEAKRIQNPDVTRRIGNAFRRHVIAWMTGKEASS